MRRTIVPLLRGIYRSNKLLVAASMMFMILLFTGSLNHILRAIGVLAPDHSGDMLSREESAFDIDFMAFQKLIGMGGGGNDRLKKGKKSHRFGEKLKQEELEEEEDRLRKWEDGLQELSDMARHNADGLGGE